MADGKLFESSTQFKFLGEILQSTAQSLQPQFWFDGNKGFGSDEQPNFTDDNFWGNKLYERIRGMSTATDGTKAKTWITYKDDIKGVLASHRSNSTVKIKNRFEEGKLHINHLLSIYFCFE